MPSIRAVSSTMPNLGFWGRCVFRSFIALAKPPPIRPRPVPRRSLGAWCVGMIHATHSKPANEHRNGTKTISLTLFLRWDPGNHEAKIHLWHLGRSILKPDVGFVCFKHEIMGTQPSKYFGTWPPSDTNCHHQTNLHECYNRNPGTGNDCPVAPYLCEDEPIELPAGPITTSCKSETRITSRCHEKHQKLVNNLPEAKTWNSKLDGLSRLSFQHPRGLRSLKLPLTS